MGWPWDPPVDHNRWPVCPDHAEPVPPYSECRECVREIQAMLQEDFCGFLQEQPSNRL